MTPGNRARRATCRAQRRNASTPPIARVEILWSENGTVPKRVFRSLAEVDAALARAFAKEPPPVGGGYDKTAFLVVWTDGKRHEGRADVREEDVRTAPAAGGIIRQHLGHVATYYRERPIEWLTDAEREEARAWGHELAARLAAEPPLPASRNGSTVPHEALLPVGTSDPEPTPTLLPDPMAAVDALEAHFAAVRPAIGMWKGSLRVPNMTNSDTRYATNWLSVALAHDIGRLRHLTGRPHGRIWDLWRKIVTDIARTIGDDPDATYPRAVYFWNEQARDLGLAVAEALHAATARNAYGGDPVSYRVTSRHPTDGSLVTTHHTAVDVLDAKAKAAAYLGYKPTIVHVDGNYHGDVWSRV